MSPRVCLFAILALAAQAHAHAAGATAPLAVKLRVLPTCIAKTAPHDRVLVRCGRVADGHSNRIGTPAADSETAHVVRTHRHDRGSDGAHVVTIEF